MVTKLEWSKLCSRIRREAEHHITGKTHRVSLSLGDHSAAFNMLMQLGKFVWSSESGARPAWWSARERVERVASAAVGSTPTPLMLAPNDLRRLIDALDAYERKNKGLRTRVAKAFALIDASKHPDINAVYAELEELLSI